MKTNFYTNMLLTVIAALLAWNAFLKTPSATVHAQTSAHYRSVGLVAEQNLGDQINKALVKGELVQVLAVPFTNGQGGQTWVTFAIIKDR